MPVVTVAVEPPYDVIVGGDALEQLPGVVNGRRRVHVVSQQQVWSACGNRLAEAGATALGALTQIGEGEEAKSMATVELLCREFVRDQLSRADVVVAVGGGVVGDTVGLAAAVYHRGIDVVQVPTTLLAQVDAAIGGKTAVNLPEGKNLVGAFHQPIAVIADTTTLATLPDADYRSGLGEVVKYALMPEGQEVASILESESDTVLEREPEVLGRLVSECVAIKGKIVAADPEERTGARATLNLGHTLAHALETTSGHTLAHGEAVAIGLVFALNLAHQLERVGADAPERAVTILQSLGLPVAVPDTAPSASDLLAVMARDKKAKGGLTFVLPTDGALSTVDDPPQHALDAAFRSVGVGT
ncbi:MAG: 3-dehydroquinate synthase [Actinobacteria bacterium]|nr:3-dehydroquinate synthase [Actinomycetota bacterium]